VSETPWQRITGANLEHEIVEFNVECVSNIEWDDECFNNLAVDTDRKLLITSLVKSHANQREKQRMDDFVAGKGLGLIMNLFGMF
jgi:hypothetical protein